MSVLITYSFIIFRTDRERSGKDIDDSTAMNEDLAASGSDETKLKEELDAEKGAEGSRDSNRREVCICIHQA